MRRTCTTVHECFNLPPAVLDAVRLLRDDRNDLERSRHRPEAWSELVFTTAARTPIDPSNYRILIKELARAAGIGHLAPYDLRHTAASLLSDAGVHNHELADLLGHTTTRMVEVHYRHRLKKTIDVAVAPMQDLVGQPEPDDDDEPDEPSS